MNSDKLNIAIETGADFRMRFTIYDNDDHPVDLTGATVEAQLREFETSIDHYNFVATHNDLGGTVTILMPKEVTALIPYSAGCYDVFVTLAGGTRSRVLFGTAKIEPSVTRPIDGTMIYMIGVVNYNALPNEGQINRLYFVYETGDILRWNGTNYISVERGRITGISLKEHVNEFVDIYTITYEDGSTFDYTVVSNGITDIEKIASSGDEKDGIVDTYRINFYNGTHYDYMITNGKKGDPGDVSDLGKLAFEDKIDYQSDLLINKPESLHTILDRLVAVYPDIPYQILLAIYISDETLYLGEDIGTYTLADESLELPVADTQGVRFEYVSASEAIKIIPGTAWLTKLGFESKIDDAPSDGNFYARRNGSWVSISGGGTLSTISYDTANESLVITDIDEEE